MTTSIDYADKISKLLTKAEGTSEAEAEALRERAYDLMVKYSISQAEIDARSAKKGGPVDDIVTYVVTLSGIYKDAMLQLMHEVVVSFGTMSDYAQKNTYLWAFNPNERPRTRGHAYFVVGFRSDVEQLKMLLPSLELQAVSALREWWQTDESALSLKAQGTKMEQFKARREFILCFGLGAAERIKARLNAALQESSTGTELVLRDRKTAVDNWLSENTNLQKGRKTTMQRGHIAAAMAGYSAGQQANTGEDTIEE